MISEFAPVFLAFDAIVFDDKKRTCLDGFHFLENGIRNIFFVAVRRYRPGLRRSVLHLTIIEDLVFSGRRSDSSVQVRVPDAFVEIEPPGEDDEEIRGNKDKEKCIAETFEELFHGKG